MKAKMAAIVEFPIPKNVKSLRRFLCDKAFNQIKGMLSSNPILKAPDFICPFRLVVDDSDQGIGSVLQLKTSDSQLHPVHYYSKRLNKFQESYSTIEKETFAQILSLQHFEIYVTALASSTIVYTDHNLRQLQNWSLAYPEYNLQIKHIKGSENMLANALSRC